VVTIEDGVRQGGFGSAVLEMLQDHGCRVPVLRLGIPDEFIQHGKREKLLEMLELDGPGVARNVRSFVSGVPLDAGPMELGPLPKQG
jgi:1-deoxy-D-xylulose-5-phosphate synthase